MVTLAPDCYTFARCETRSLGPDQTPLQKGQHAGSSTCLRLLPVVGTAFLGSYWLKRSRAGLYLHRQAMVHGPQMKV